VAAYGRQVIPHFNKKSVRAAKPAAKKKPVKRAAPRKARR
jgi:hypothetical protein